MEWINLGAVVTEKDGILTADAGNVLTGSGSPSV